MKDIAQALGVSVATVSRALNDSPRISTERKEAIKAAEKTLLADYSDELKDCTISQGKVLLKLIDRETGRTSYVLVNELRGKLRAGVYQTFARLFGYNLKASYDPKHNKEDNLIERIVLSVERGKL
jgi:transcriptional regulator with XRE-family HTH domain